MYNTKVTVKADIASSDRRDLETTIYTYLDDSLKVVEKSIVGISRVINPPIFDSINIDRSKTFVTDYLNSLGYYQANLDTFSVKFDTVSSRQIRVSTKLDFNANKQETFDSVWYDMKKPELQQLAVESQGNSILKKGAGYSTQVVAQELDRLVQLYRSRGYYRMGRSSLLAEGDTTNQALISLQNDPFLLLQQTQLRRDNPTIDLRIFQRPGVDSSFFQKYKVGKITFFPETSIDDNKDSLIHDTSSFLPLRNNGRDGIFIRHKYRSFRPRTVRRFNEIQSGKYYNEQDYYKTFNTISQAGSWQSVDVKPITYKDSTDSSYKVDFNFFLTPAHKFSFKADFEGSQNISRNSIDALTGTFFGISVAGSLLNRNFARSAIQWSNNLRAGVEINTKSSSNSNLFQTIQLSGGTSFSVPRLWPPLRQLIKNADAGRTFLNINGGYSNRRQFFELRNLSVAYGYEWKKKGTVYTINFPNFELVDLLPTPTFSQLLDANRVLSYSFNQGVVLGASFVLQRTITYANHPNWNSYLRGTAETSGPFTGNLFFKNTLLHFWKLDGEFRHNIIHTKHKWAFRLIGGFGRDYSASDKTLPFFRQFLAGGPNSMRAWRLRQLGLGNSLAQDSSTSNFKDRLGDIYLETNAEYRFAMFKLFAFPIEGALFTDIGNIWSRKSQMPNALNDGVFRLKTLYRDLAMDLGYGIRWDFNYLRVRFDLAYKVKDPVREGAGWMHRVEWKSYNRLGQDPNKPDRNRNNNVGFQFGIDYPF